MTDQLLLVGGSSDGQRLTALFGDSIITENPATGEREIYRIVSLSGGTRVFLLAVIETRFSDGDWVIEQLLAKYQGGVS